MATFLDIGLLEHFSIIFYLVFIFVLMYAILSVTKILGEDKNINAMLAGSLALILALSGTTRDLISFVTPTFFVFIFFVFFTVLIYKFMGASDKDVTEIFSTKAGTRGFILAIVGIIILSSLGKIFFTGSTTVLSDNTTMTANQSAVGTVGQSALTSTLTHPKVLGLILILIIAAYAMSFLSRPAGILKGD